MKPVKSPAPRIYRMGRRQVSTDKTRAKLLAAARRLLMSERERMDWSLETVAKRAGVTRLTVYHQFGSKTGLLEALYDDLARHGRIGENLAAAFQQSDAMRCLDAVIEAFVHFWSSERAAIRRLRAMAALDKTFKGATERDQRRKTALQAVMQRFAAASGGHLAEATARTEALAMLTSFETFDALARPDTDATHVLSMIRSLARSVLEWS